MIATVILVITGVISAVAGEILNDVEMTIFGSAVMATGLIVNAIDGLRDSVAHGNAVIIASIVNKEFRKVFDEEVIKEVEKRRQEAEE